MIRKASGILAWGLLLTVWGGFVLRPATAEAASVNPHVREGCLACHLAEDLGQALGTLILTPEENTPHAVLVHSCRTCHEEETFDFWIVVLPSGQGRTQQARIPPGTSTSPQISIPKDAIPGVFMGAPPAQETQEEGFANSHDTMECAKCHENDPGKITKTSGASAPTAAFTYGSGGVDSYCRHCHLKVEKEHYPRGNRPKEKITCLSCHQVHNSTLLFPALREDYPLVITGSSDLNPHGGRIFCMTCHPNTPPEGGPASFRQGSDGNSMCQRCHDAVEHHPLRVKSSPGTWKMDFSDFPLEREQITCVTCHDPYECENTITSENPRFLRGGPYNTVEEFCMRCHEGRSFVNLNPHDQIDDAGNVLKKQCLYCHTSVPEGGGYDLGASDFTDGLKELCASCHPVAPHPDVDHIVKLSVSAVGELADYEEKRLVSLPLENEMFVTCVTCHNPHEKGLLLGPAGVGADEKTRLRLATFNEICTPCHGRH